VLVTDASRKRSPKRPRLVGHQLILGDWLSSRDKPGWGAAEPQTLFPVSWRDLPEGPLSASVSDGAPVLRNQSRRDLDCVAIGCVIDVRDRAHVVGGLFSVSVFDAVVVPGDHFDSCDFKDAKWIARDARCNLDSAPPSGECSTDTTMTVIEARSRGR
jgi:hypothetical protein